MPVVCAALFVCLRFGNDLHRRRASPASGAIVPCTGAGGTVRPEERSEVDVECTELTIVLCACVCVCEEIKSNQFAFAQIT